MPFMLPGINFDTLCHDPRDSTKCFGRQIISVSRVLPLGIIIEPFHYQTVRFYVTRVKSIVLIYDSKAFYHNFVST